VKILLVYPRYPDTFWSFRHALKFISKKANFPPLGLLTVAAMLPAECEKRLVDMNTEILDDVEIEWADFVFISAMVVQTDSVREVITRCNMLGTKIVAGGPLFTTGYEEFEGIDHFVLGEAEITLPWFLGVTDKGRQYFWRLLILTLLQRPRHFALSIGLSVSGFHFRKVAESYNKTVLTLRRQSV
jgi:radical SAM superfamily enzyme YgiQ (UPF0313 family)